MAYIFQFNQQRLRAVFAGTLIALCGATAVAAEPTKQSNGYVAQMRKVGTEVDVAIKLPVAPVALGPMAIEMTLSSTIKNAKVELSYGVEGSIRVDTGAPETVVLDSDGKGNVRVPLTVLGQGVHYLNLFVTQNKQMAVYSVRIDTGAGKKASKALVETPAFIGMPAQETRRP